MTRCSEHKERQPDTRLTILAIDDVPSVIDLMAKGLQAYGHTVLTAPSGQLGIELFKTHSVDVVLCDLAMPGMNGWEVGKAIRAICNEKGVPKSPFILVTGCSCQISYQNRLAESGVDAVAEKPVEFGALLTVITETIRRSVAE